MKQTKQLKFFDPTNSLIKVKKELDYLFEDDKVKFGIRLSFGLLIFLFLIVFVFWGKLPPENPLFYSRPWGEEQLAGKKWFLILPLTCFLLIIFNLRLASFLLKKEQLLAKMLIWTTVILTLLTSITIIRVLLLIF